MLLLLTCKGASFPPSPILPPPGCCSLAKMLYCTSLVAFVGAGEQPHLTPRKLTLLNSHSNSVIQALSFPSTVLGLQLNRKRWVGGWVGVDGASGLAGWWAVWRVDGGCSCSGLPATTVPPLLPPSRC